MDVAGTDGIRAEMQWLMLSLAIVFEVAATTSLKLAEGLSRPIPLAAALGLYTICFLALAQAFKTIPVATAYAIWSGAGMVLIAAVGYVWFREPLTLLKLTFITLILIGVIGLHLVTESR